PGAKFLCLYRHPMDVIASGLEAFPWGLSGSGPDSSGDRSPHATAQALARFWAANVTLSLAVEERCRECAYRVRYEDLVADPEGVGEAIFRFLGVPPVPGLPAACFTGGRAEPSDYKIWHASRINPGSVGRGWSIPAAMIGSPMAATVNTLADKLGYARIDADLQTPAAADPGRPGGRAMVTERPAGGGRPAPRAGLGRRRGGLGAGGRRSGPEAGSRPPACGWWWRICYRVWPGSMTGSPSDGSPARWKRSW